MSLAYTTASEMLAVIVNRLDKIIEMLEGSQRTRSIMELKGLSAETWNEALIEFKDKMSTEDKSSDDYTFDNGTKPRKR